MAKAESLMPFVLRWEGGYCDDPDDRGGATNKGVTLATFRRYYGANATKGQLQAMTDAQWLHIFRRGYWDEFRADEINNQSVADACVDWAWNSGTVKAAKKVQAVLGVTADGIVGQRTLAAINAAQPRQLFAKIKAARLRYVENIAKNNPKQKKFLKGWKNRINSLIFTA